MRTFQLWVEGYRATGEHATARLLGDVTGDSFVSAVQAYVNALPPSEKVHWQLGGEPPAWRCWGCQAFDNETDARKAFG